MLIEKKRYQVEIAYRGSDVIMVAADDITEALHMATEWFLEHRQPDIEWQVLSVERLPVPIVYEI